MFDFEDAKSMVVSHSAFIYYLVIKIKKRQFRIEKLALDNVSTPFFRQLGLDFSNLRY
jgi:hypothetical protein